ncbi:hypothetical protein F5884DRAFT_784533 [Xylogone sp. PMI_703]|nr:hypothetical protein F5884DRAFT_784533 [Xylogone sp. PMI_703]
MSTAGVGQADQALPSFEALRNSQQHIRLSPDAQSLFWSLDGPLTSSIWIMESARNPDSLEPYCRQTTGTDTDWHPASQSPLTEPKVSSVTVTVYDLELWEDQWLDVHRDHADPEGGDENGDGVEFGELPDYNPDEDEEGPEHLLMCCGTKRPRGKAARLVVKPTASGNGFLTIHDYVSAVHPWLMSLREDLLAAMAVWDDEPLPSETKLMVNYTALDRLKMYEREEWISLKRGRPS